jgi:osmotically-inducible protein OsmY
MMMKITLISLMVPLATILLTDANACRIDHSLYKSKSKIESARCDAKITATLQNALQEDADLSIPTIHVKTHQQIVTLYGKIYTLEEKRVVMSLAKSIKGVKSVHSTLRMS